MAAGMIQHCDVFATLEAVGFTPFDYRVDNSPAHNHPLWCQYDSVPAWVLEPQVSVRRNESVLSAYDMKLNLWTGESSNSVDFRLCETQGLRLTVRQAS